MWLVHEEWGEGGGKESERGDGSDDGP